MNSEEKEPLNETRLKVADTLSSHSRETQNCEKPLRLRDHLRHKLRTQHYGNSTVESYCRWVERFVLFHKKRHPAKMGETEINHYLSYLALKGKVSASTQNQALSAILYFYRNVLDREIGDLRNVIRAKNSERLPIVLTRDEVKDLLGRLRGQIWLAASLMYGSGLRVHECLTLRVQDIDFGRNEVSVRAGKGSKDRVTMLAKTSRQPLLDHLERVRL